MKACVFRAAGQPLEIADVPDPVAGEGEIVVRVKNCGVCGSDLHFLVEWGGRKGVIEGHEFSGTVAALGTGVTGWSVGDRVVPGPTMLRLRLPAEERTAAEVIGRGPEAAPAVVDLLERIGVLAG